MNIERVTELLNRLDYPEPYLDEQDKEDFRAALLTAQAAITSGETVIMELKAALAHAEPVLKAIREVDKSIVEHALKHSQWGWCPDCQEAAKKIKAAWNIPQSWRDEEAKHV